MDSQKLQRLKKLYDKFTVKDLPFDDFVKAFTKLSAPVSQQEILDLQMEKAEADSHRIYTQNKGLILPSNLN